MLAENDRFLTFFNYFFAIIGVWLEKEAHEISILAITDIYYLVVEVYQ